MFIINIIADSIVYFIMYLMMTFSDAKETGIFSMIHWVISIGFICHCLRFIKGGSRGKY